ncbi:MAG: PH domain-containing protein [Pseudomonadota bacterium]
MDNATDPTKWNRLSPLAVLSFLFKAGRALVQSLPAFIPAFIFVRNSEYVTYAFPAGMLLLLWLGVVFPILSWVYFRYRLTPTQIQVQSGILSKKRTSIDHDRIQGINVTQNPIFRLARVFTIELDTAGSAKEEVSLPGVSQPVLDLLRSINLASENTVAPADSLKPLLQLDRRSVLRIGLTSNTLVFIAIILAPLFSFSDSIFERFAARVLSNTFEPFFQWLFQLPLLGLVPLVLFTAILITLFLVGLSVVGALIRYDGFRLNRIEDRVRSTAGLLTRHEQSLRLQKIQTIKMSQNVRQRLLRCFRVTLTQASSHETTEKKSFKVPLIDKPGIARLVHHIYPRIGSLGFLSNYQRIDGRYKFQVWRNFFFIPITLTTMALVPWFGYGSLFAISLAALGYPLIAQRYRRWGYLSNDRYAFVRKGLFGEQHTIFELRRAQRVSLSQSPYQRRKQLASLTVYLASETIHLPFIPYDDAQNLQNQILYLSESDRLAWI